MFPIGSLSNNIKQLDLGWGSGKDKETMYFVIVFKTIYKSVSRYNGKAAQKEISKLFL